MCSANAERRTDINDREDAQSNPWWRWRYLLYGLGVIVVLYGIYRGVLIWRVKAAIGRLERAGHVTTLEGLNGYYSEPSEGENAADLYRRAFDAYVEGKDKTTGRSPRMPYINPAESRELGEPLSEETLRTSVRHLRANQTSLRLLHEAGDKAACRFPVDYTEWPETSMPWLAGLRRGTRLLALEAMVEAKRGNGKAAAEAVLSGLAASRLLRREPTMSGQLLRIALTAVALDGLEEAMARARIPEPYLTAIRKALAQASNTRGMRRGLEGSLATGIAFRSRDEGLEKTFRSELAWLTPEERKSRSMTLRWYGYRFSGAKELDTLVFLRATGQTFDWTRRLEPRPLADKLSGRSDDLPFYCVFSRGTHEMLGKYVREHLAEMALIRCAGAGVAVELWARDNGQVPEGLSDLVPDRLTAVSKDPYDGRPLRYGITEEGCLVYSIGRNERDDGGVSLRRGGERDKSDFVFELKR